MKGVGKYMKIGGRMKMTRQQMKQERFEYFLNTVLHKCQKEQWNKIGFTTSSLEERHINSIVESLRKKAKERQIILQVEEIKPVNYFADGIKQAITCDSVVFVERYTYSYYKDMLNCMELLQKEEIPIYGVVAYR